MSLPQDYKYDFRGLMPNLDRIAAGVPLERGQPFVGYSGMTAGIDGTIREGAWQCNCGSSPAATPYGIKDPANANIDPRRAWYAEVDCSGVPPSCTDPRALTYDPSAQRGDHLACVYATAISRQECAEARTPAVGCYRYPFPYSHN